MIGQPARIRNIRILSIAFFNYFIRKIFAFGILKSVIVRIALLVLTSLTLVILSIILYLFFDQFSAGEHELSIIVEASGVTSVLWTLVMFTFIKILFMKSDGLLRFTLTLPVNHRERTAALIFYETAMVLGAVLILFLPLAIVTSLKLGVTALPLLSAGILMPIITCYLAAALLYNVIITLFLRLGSPRLAHLGALVFLTITVICYDFFLLEMVNRIFSDSLSNKRSFIGANLFSYLLGASGFVVTVFAFLLAAAPLLPLLMWSSPKRYHNTHQFMHTRVPLTSLSIWPTVTALTRRMEWWVTVTMAYTIMAMLFFNGGDSFVYAACLLLSQGIYAFAITEPLRRMPGYRKSPVAEVTHLLVGQVIVVTFFALPVGLLAACRPSAFSALPMAALLLLSGIVTTTLIGIVMVPEHDNPIMAFTSYAAAIAILFSLTVMIGFLQPPAPVLWGSAVAINFMAILYSIFGIIYARRRNRYASFHTTH